MAAAYDPILAEPDGIAVRKASKLAHVRFTDDRNYGIGSKTMVCKVRNGRSVKIGALWIGACAAAELIGMGAAASAGAAAAYLNPGDGDATFATRCVLYGLFVAAGGIEGAALGIFQGAALNTWIRSFALRRWIGACVAIGVIGWAVGMIAPIFGAMGTQESWEPPAALQVLFMALAGAGAGAVVGGVQAWALARSVIAAWRWIPASMLGWGLAFMAIQTGAGLPETDWPLGLYALDGIVTGLVAGLLLGVATLPTVLRYSRQFLPD